MAERKCEAIGQPNRPNVLIPHLAELPAIAAHRSQAVPEVVIHAEFKLPRIHRRQRIAREPPYKILLHARNELRSAHGVLPERNLVQTVGRFDPVTAPPGRALIFPAEFQWQRGRLPAAVKTEGVRALVLQQMLKGTAEFEPRVRNENPQPSAHKTVRVERSNVAQRNRAQWGERGGW